MKTAPITTGKAIHAPAYGAVEFRRGLEHYTLGRATAAVCSVVTIIALVRLMPIAQYAVYTAASAVAVLAATLSILGLDRVAMRFIPIGKMAGRPAELYRFVVRLLGVRVLTIGCIMLLFAALREPIGALLQFEEDGSALLAPLLVYMAAIALGECLTSVLQSLMSQEGLRWAISVQWSMRLAFVIAVALQGMEVHAWHALWAWAISEVFFVILMLYAMHRSIGTSTAADGRDSWRLDRGEVLRTAAANSLGSFAALLWQPYTMRVVAATILTAGELAAYGFFLALLERIRAYLPAQFVQGIAEPMLSSAIARRRDPLVISEYFGALLNVTAWIMLPLILAVALAGETVINVVTGGKFGEYSPVLAVLLLQLLVGTPVTLLWSALNVTGRTRSLAKSMILPTLVTFPLLLLAGLAWGALGMAIVAVINIVASRALMMKGLHGTTIAVGFTDECIVRSSWQSAVAVIPIATVVFTSIGAEPFRVLGVCIMSAVLYVLLGLRFPPLSQGQLASLIRMLPWSSRLFDQKVIGARAVASEATAARQ